MSEDTDKAAPISGTITCLSPGQMVAELRRVADMLEAGDLVYKSGGMLVNSPREGAVHIQSDLTLVMPRFNQ